MIGMIRVQLEKVPVMLKNRKILVRTMNLYAEDFFQESRSFPDIFTKRFIPKPFKLQPNSGADASRAMLLSKLSSPIPQYPSPQTQKPGFTPGFFGLQMSSTSSSRT